MKCVIRVYDVFSSYISKMKKKTNSRKISKIKQLGLPFQYADIKDLTPAQLRSEIARVGNIAAQTMNNDAFELLSILKEELVKKI